MWRRRREGKKRWWKGRPIPGGWAGRIPRGAATENRDVEAKRPVGETLSAVRPDAHEQGHAHECIRVKPSLTRRVNPSLSSGPEVDPTIDQNRPSGYAILCL